MKIEFTDSQLYLIEFLVQQDNKGDNDPDVKAEYNSILLKLKQWRENKHGFNKAFRILANLPNAVKETL